MPALARESDYLGHFVLPFPQPESRFQHAATPSLTGIYSSRRWRTTSDISAGTSSGLPCNPISRRRRAVSKRGFVFPQCQYNDAQADRFGREFGSSRITWPRRQARHDIDRPRPATTRGAATKSVRSGIVRIKATHHSNPRQWRKLSPIEPKFPPRPAVLREVAPTPLLSTWHNLAVVVRVLGRRPDAVKL